MQEFHFYLSPKVVRRRTRRNLSLTLLSLCATTAFAAAAPATKKPAKKAAKPASKPKLIREVMGTTQLSGYEGAIGQTFTVGNSSAVNFTLKRAEYSINRVNIGQYSHLPKGDEKLLVLHFSVQNPLKRAFNYTPSYLTFKAVDASGVTRDAISDAAREITGESVYYNLQPGQKIDVYTAIRVAAYGEVPKLLVRSSYDSEAPIVRYDLRGKVAKLGAPFADPADAKGATARKMVPSKNGVFYPVADPFDVRLDGISFSSEAMNGSKPDEGKRYCVAAATIKNRGARATRFSASYVRADLKDADGERVVYNQRVLKASRDEESFIELAPGEEMRVRFYWILPTGVDAKTVLFQNPFDSESRTYAVNVTTSK